MPNKNNSADRTAKFDRPVPIGVSTGHPAITAGTIGARVIDEQGNVYALSNNHVYADQNDANIGAAVIQPGTFDGGSSPADSIGALAKYVPIDFSGANNEVDAAIAETTKQLLSNATPSDGYGPHPSTWNGLAFPATFADNTVVDKRCSIRPSLRRSPCKARNFCTRCETGEVVLLLLVGAIVQEKFSRPQ